MKIKALVLTFLIAGLIFGAYSFGRNELQHKTTPLLFPNLDTASINRIEITQDQQTKVLIKKDNNWQEESATVSAKLESINELLNTVKNLESAQPVSNNVQKQQIFGVDNTALKVVLKNGSNNLAVLLVGKRGQDYISNFYRKDDDNNVYLSKVALDTIMTAPLANQ